MESSFTKVLAVKSTSKMHRRKLRDFQGDFRLGYMKISTIISAYGPLGPIVFKNLFSTNCTKIRVKS